MSVTLLVGDLYVDPRLGLRYILMYFDDVIEEIIYNNYGVLKFYECFLARSVVLWSWSP